MEEVIPDEIEFVVEEIEKDLQEFSGKELSNLCKLCEIPFSGTKLEKIKRLMEMERATDKIIKSDTNQKTHYMFHFIKLSRK